MPVLQHAANSTSTLHARSYQLYSLTVMPGVRSAPPVRPQQPQLHMLQDIVQAGLISDAQLETVVYSSMRFGMRLPAGPGWCCNPTSWPDLIARREPTFCIRDADASPSCAPHCIKWHTRFYRMGNAYMPTCRIPHQHHWDRVLCSA